MLLTSSLVFSQEDYLAFTLKINFISAWLNCIFAYALLIPHKHKFTQLLLIMDAFMTFVAGLLIAFDGKPLNFSIICTTGFSGILVARIYFYLQKRTFIVATEAMETTLYVFLSASLIILERMSYTSSFLIVGYCQIIITCLFFAVNIITLLYRLKKLFNSACKAIKKWQKNISLSKSKLYVQSVK
jgi:hypothetical protein